MRRLLVFLVAVVLVSAPLFAQKKDTYRVRTVVVDPGHGGAKPGAKGSRSFEKDITLAVALKFGKLLKDNYPDLNVIYTRTTDVDISLAERAHIANRNKADLFISIHANSHPTSAPTGVETFVMGLSESRANLEVAKTENADILLEADYKKNEAYRGFDPNAPESFVMLAMFQNAFIDKSLNLAQAIQNQYKQQLRTVNRGVKQAELFVLYKTTCPSVLTEIGFISNPDEESFMLSDEGQAKIAVSLFNAFMNYKATEEGSDRPSSVKISLPGYSEPQKEEPKAAPAPAVVEAPAQEGQGRVEVPADTVAAPIVVAEVAAPEPKPTPTVQLPAAPAPEPVVPTPAPEPVAPAPAPEPVVAPSPEPAPTPTPEPAPVAAPEPAPAPTLEPPTNTAPAEARQYYTVQFLTSNTAYDEGNPALGGVRGVERSHNGKFYVYSVGRFATFQEATAYSQHLKATTRFKDAWALLKKESVPGSQAAQGGQTVQNGQGAHAAPQAQPAKASGTTYRIQFCSATREMKAGDPALQGITDFRYSRDGQYYIYTAGDYPTRAEAAARLAEIKRTTNFKDAFIVAFRDGKRL